DRALQIYDAQVRQIPGANPIEVTVNDATNSIEVVADPEAMDRFVDIIDELQRQTGPARDVRMIELRFAQVGEVISFLEEMVAASESLRIQGGPDPVFEPIESTNSILVAAQPTQFAIIEQLVQSIDNQQTVDRPPLRIMRLEATEAASLAQVLSESFDRRAVEERAQKPVEVRADVATNTLIVSAHPDVLPEIQSIVDELNEQSRFSNEGREIRIFPLRVARAEDLAMTIDQMFPEPPMPYDNRGRPLPHLRQPKEIFVRADATTNSLIVDAPSQRLAGFEQIVQSLDQRSFAEDVEVRTYRLTKADLDAVATAIRELASKGALGDVVGQTPVTVSTEPAMRTLVVSGPATIFTNIERVLQDFDRANDQPGTVLRMYRLQHARADHLQP
ncbi:MAG: hypothetical protein KDA28_16160, partial [Phycisphaerales bacterium]|nr:hypothetical protein [Phycisphaerales bacterium]